MKALSLLGISILGLVAGSTAATSSNAAIYTNGYKGSTKQVAPKDSILGLAEYLEISPLFAINDNSDMEALQMMDTATKQDDGKRLLIVMNGLKDAAQFGKKQAPVFTVDQNTRKLVDFLSSASNNIQKLGNLKQKQVTSEISVLEPSTHSSFLDDIKARIGLQNGKLDQMWEELRSLYSQYDRFNKRSSNGLDRNAQFVRELTQLHYMLNKGFDKLPRGSVVIVNEQSLVSVLRTNPEAYEDAVDMFSKLLFESSALQGKDAVVVALPADGKTLKVASRRYMTPVSKRDGNVFARGKSAIKYPQTCFTTQEKCMGSTDSCSGHGTCIATGKCWSCACSSTVKGKSTKYWTGNACEQQDISSTFQLLFWTSLFIFIAMAIGAKFMYECGETKLPGVLLAATVQTKKSQ